MNEKTCEKCNQKASCDETCYKANYARLVAKYTQHFPNRSWVFETEDGSEITVALFSRVAY